MIAVSAGHDDLNLDTALAYGANQLMTRAAVGQKVGRRDKDALTRRGEQRLIKDTRPRGHAGRGRAVDDEGRGLALSFFLRGGTLGVGENLAGGFEPVLCQPGPAAGVVWIVSARAPPLPSSCGGKTLMSVGISQEDSSQFSTNAA